MAEAQKKPELHLAGPRPSFDDMMKLYKKLTGREPTAQEMQEARKVWGEDR